MSENTSPVGYAEFVRKLFNRSGDPSKDFAHVIIGIATEIYEYQCATDEVNGLEELGDLEFYVEAARQVIFDHTGKTFEVRIEPLLARLAAAKYTEPETIIQADVTDLLDEAKRWIGYGKEPEDFNLTWNALVALVRLVNSKGPYPCNDHQRIVTTNMAKLLKRYPNGEFDAYRAVVRDLQGERDVLQAS